MGFTCPPAPRLLGFTCPPAPRLLGFTCPPAPSVWVSHASCAPPAAFHLPSAFRVSPALLRPILGCHETGLEDDVVWPVTSGPGGTVRHKYGVTFDFWASGSGNTDVTCDFWASGSENTGVTCDFWASGSEEGCDFSTSGLNSRQVVPQFQGSRAPKPKSHASIPSPAQKSQVTARFSRPRNPKVTPQSPGPAPQSHKSRPVFQKSRQPLPASQTPPPNSHSGGLVCHEGVEEAGKNHGEDLKSGGDTQGTHYLNLKPA